MDQQRTPGGPTAPQKPVTQRPRPAAFWLILPLIVTGMMLVFYYTGEQNQRSQDRLRLLPARAEQEQRRGSGRQRRQDSRHVQENSRSRRRRKPPRAGKKHPLKQDFYTDLPNFVGPDLDKLLYEKLGAHYAAE